MSQITVSSPRVTSIGLFSIKTFFGITSPIIRANPPGRYTPETDAQGFATWKHAAFGLNLDQEQRRDIRLEVGTTGQTITVAETPEALNTENGSRGDVTSNAALTEIPLNGRNYSDLSFLTGSVVPKSDSTNGQFTVNGARADNVVLTLASGLTA